MTASPNDSRDRDRSTPGVGHAEDDLAIVPGLGPAPSDVPAPRTGQPHRLDPAQDPDRFDAAGDAVRGPLDPAADPDRYRAADQAPPGQGQTLTELLGEGAFEDKRNGYEWALGLLAVIAFLALVSWLFSSVVSP